MFRQDILGWDACGCTRTEGLVSSACFGLLRGAKCERSISIVGILDDSVCRCHGRGRVLSVLHVTRAVTVGRACEIAWAALLESKGACLLSEVIFRFLDALDCSTEAESEVGFRLLATDSAPTTYAKNAMRSEWLMGTLTPRTCYEPLYF